jgi:hypothetical protein
VWVDGEDGVEGSEKWVSELQLLDTSYVDSSYEEEEWYEGDGLRV